MNYWISLCGKQQVKNYSSLHNMAIRPQKQRKKTTPPKKRNDMYMDWLGLHVSLDAAFLRLTALNRVKKSIVPLRKWGAKLLWMQTLPSSWLVVKQEDEDEYNRLWKHLARVTHSRTDEFTLLPVVLQASDSIVGTLGNFSVSTGKEKAKKTFNVSAIVAASLVNGQVLEYKASFP